MRLPSDGARNLIRAARRKGFIKLAARNCGPERVRIVADLEDGTGR
jgi:hypothetical protein